MINSDKTASAYAAAVIVTYNAKKENLLSLVQKLSDQVFLTIIVDNASSNAKEISEAVALVPRTKFIELDQNYGIAYAQNIGIREGIEQNATHTILFDQDSAITDSFAVDMLEQFLAIQKKEPIGTLGPTLQDARYGYIYPVIRLSKHGFRKKVIPEPGSKNAVEVSCIIASGSLIDNKVFETVGYFNESLFIDYVDTEWCLRCLDKKFKVFVTPQVVMQHEIGDTHISLLRFIIPVHSPWRRYYRVRNGFYLLLMPHVPKLISCREITFSFIHQIILFVVKKDVDYLKYYLKSARDGIKNIYATYHNRKS